MGDSARNHYITGTRRNRRKSIYAAGLTSTVSALTRTLTGPAAPGRYGDSSGVCAIHRSGVGSVGRAIQ